MPIEKAPYLNYTEETSYIESANNGSEIPIFIVKSDKTVTVDDIDSKNILLFNRYNKFKKEYNLSDDEEEYNELDDSLKEIDTILKGFFKENTRYGEMNSYGLPVPYIYIIDIGNNPTVAHYKKALKISERKRDATALILPQTEDIKLMKETKNILMEELKTSLLRIAYFKISGQGELSFKYVKGEVIRPTFNHHGYIDIVQGYLKTDSDDKPQDFYRTPEYKNTEKITANINHIYYDLTSDKHYTYNNNKFTEVDLNTLEGYSEVVEGYKKEDDNTKFYEDSSFKNQITPLSETTIYIDKNTKSNSIGYYYKNSEFTQIQVIPTTEVLYEDDEDYKFLKKSTKKEFGGVDESFEDYCKRLQFISQEIQSSRVCIVNNEYFGETIARICSTPYYIEPGYLPYVSINAGVFQERTIDERDALFNSGLIFNEDDIYLANPTPRICAATSTAWGVEDIDLRPTDALLHARRNVDNHIRKILTLIAPQLKRNETSVALRYVENQIDVYLDSELTNGTIMEYSFNVSESEYDPYQLIFKVKITPVNSTYAIEYENTVGNPYTVASNYI